jgi:shikimate 5-dehydrogenase
MSQEYMGFIGVSTGGSLIMKVFPAWAEILGLPTNRLVGFDVVPGSPDEVYVDLVQRLRDDPDYRGALVTTHKMAVYRAASQLFDEFDDFALACKEVSSIAKRDGGKRLLGGAKDPITAGLALEQFLPADYFASTGASMVILGAGGSGTALSWYMQDRPDRPERITVTARRQASLDQLRAIHDARGTSPDAIDYVLAPRPEDVDAILAAQPAGTVVVNATGMGKDIPGSPLSDAVVFPQDGYVWEFNYRGSLEFMHQALAQAEARNLTVVDGWDYFIHGWSQVVAEVFELELTPERFEAMSKAAYEVR